MQSLTVFVKGLYTSPNQFSSVPDGALELADNIVIDRANIAETRRGQKEYGINLATITNPDGVYSKLYNYNNTLIAYVNEQLAYDSDNAGTFVKYSSTYPAFSGYALRGLEANKNFYVSAANGIKKIDSVTGAFVLAGAPQGLDGTASLSAGTALPTDRAVAYRIVWGYKDANDNEILGVPSTPLIVRNSTGSTQNVALTYAIPEGVTTSYFYRIYRSDESATAATDPNDEMGLVLSGSPSGAEITAKAFTATDSQVSRGETLYTSPSQQGILQANYRPPIAKDMCLWNQYVFYANTAQPHRFIITLLNVTGLTVGSTFTIDPSSGSNLVFTADTANDPALNEFELVTGGTAEENIRDTAQNLVYVINRATTNTQVYAYYVSGLDDTPGKILLENRINQTGLAPFSLFSSSTTAWFPALNNSTSTAISSDEEKQNRVYISKFQQPEAVPILQYLDAGSENYPLRRILPLKDAVIIIKDDGIFQITGTGPDNFSLSLLDATTEISCGESAVVLNDKIYMISTRGMVKVSMEGVDNTLNEPLEQTFLRLQSGILPNFASLSFGVAYEADKKYIFYTVTETTDTQSTQQFVYDYTTEQWTRWLTVRSCVIVSTRDKKLYSGTFNADYSSIQTYQERKSFDRTDYADREIGVTIVSSSTTTEGAWGTPGWGTIPWGAAFGDTFFLVVVNSTAGIEAGWTLKQGSLESVILEVVSSTNLIVSEDLDWTAGAATAYEPISCAVKFSPNGYGNPAINKQVREVIYLFNDASFNQMTAGFESNFTGRTEIPVDSYTRGSWGAFPWGSIAWGGLLGGRQPLRTYVPATQQWCFWLSLDIAISQAFNSFGLMGISSVYEEISTRIR